MALAGEVGELPEHFQWLTAEQSAELPDETREKVEQEIADVQIYLAALADRLGVQIGPAVARKMALRWTSPFWNEKSAITSARSMPA